MKKLMILSGVALLGLAGGALAQSAGDGPRRGADTTRAAVIQRSDAAFARLDANGDDGDLAKLLAFVKTQVAATSGDGAGRDELIS